MVKLTVQGTNKQWSNKKPYITNSSKKNGVTIQAEKTPIFINNNFRRSNSLQRRYY